MSFNGFFRKWLFIQLYITKPTDFHFDLLTEFVSSNECCSMLDWDCRFAWLQLSKRNTISFVCFHRPFALIFPRIRPLFQRSFLPILFADPREAYRFRHIFLRISFVIRVFLRRICWKRYEYFFDDYNVFPTERQAFGVFSSLIISIGFGNGYIRFFEATPLFLSIFLDRFSVPDDFLSMVFEINYLKQSNPIKSQTNWKSIKSKSLIFAIARARRPKDSSEKLKRKWIFRKFWHLKWLGAKCQSHISIARSFLSFNFLFFAV